MKPEYEIYTMFKFLILFTVVFVKTEFVRRQFDNDEFIESQHAKCNDGSTSYTKTRDGCTCKEGTTFFPHKNHNCYTKEEISDISGT